MLHILQFSSIARFVPLQSEHFSKSTFSKQWKNQPWGTVAAIFNMFGQQHKNNHQNETKNTHTQKNKEKKLWGSSKQPNERTSSW